MSEPEVPVMIEMTDVRLLRSAETVWEVALSASGRQLGKIVRGDRSPDGRVGAFDFYAYRHGVGGYMGVYPTWGRALDALVVAANAGAESAGEPDGGGAAGRVSLSGLEDRLRGTIAQCELMAWPADVAEAVAGLRVDGSPGKVIVSARQRVAAVVRCVVWATETLRLAAVGALALVEHERRHAASVDAALGEGF